MTVKVKFFAYFRDVFDAREKPVELPPDGTVGKLLQVLCDTRTHRREIFEGAALRPLVLVMINGSPIGSFQGLETPLADGDVVAVFPFVAGG